MSNPDKQPIVAIDGPSGAGKSTVSKKVAEALGFTYIDTGAMYRCVGLLAVKGNLPCEESEQLSRLLSSLKVDFEGPATKQLVFCNGDDVSEQIRHHEISKAASDFSALAPVRERLVALQREMGDRGGVVMEGRDIGTNVFPHAQVKIFLDASAEVRAKRRFDELVTKGQEVSYDQILQDQIKRDKNDSERELNPLKVADDAQVVDTSELGIDQVVQIICNIVKKKH